MPKQFVSLIGEGSTFQQVMGRVAYPELFARPIVITHPEFRFVVVEQLRDRGIAADVVLEPSRRHSGPAVAVATLLALQRDPQALALVLAADHAIRKPDAFRKVCRLAMRTAAEGRIVTFGIPPAFAAANYVYIRPGAQLDGASVHEVETFVEKPNAEMAAKYMAERYLWNSGNFLFDAVTMWEEIEGFEPLIAKAAKAAVKGATRDLDSPPRRDAFCPGTEEVNRLCGYGAHQARSRRAGGSRMVRHRQLEHGVGAPQGPVVLSDTRNSLVRSEDPILTTVIGLEDAIVVATTDAVLVAARSKAEEVKPLVEQLKAQNHRGRPSTIASIGRGVIIRTWISGRATASSVSWLSRVAPLSLQRHFNRSEHWVVVLGTAEVTAKDEVRTAHKNESIYIPISSIHQLANPGKIPLEMIEVQVGSYLGEYDIVRFDDVYGR